MGYFKKKMGGRIKKKESTKNNEQVITKLKK